MKIYTKKIGPKDAKKLLEGNTSNRLVKKVHLEWLTLQMREDKWRPETGEAIKISKNNKLLDGQHRLQAVVKSGKTYEFLIVEGLEDETYNVIDSGVARTAGDSLYIEGVKNGYALAAIIRAYAALQHKDYDGFRNFKKVNSEDILKMYREAPEIWQNYAQKSQNLYNGFHKTLTQKFIGSWYKYLSELAPEKAEEFFAKLCLGINVKTTVDPVGVYRQWLLDMKMNKMRQRSKDRNGYFILAWNAFVKGEKFRRQSYNPSKDPVPEIIIPK